MLDTGTTLDRRQFLIGLAAAPLCCGCAAERRLAARTPSRPAPKRRIDIHVHVFGTGDGGSGCSMSSRVRRGLAFRILSQTLGLEEPFDFNYRELLCSTVADSGLDVAVILAQDGVYDSRGQFDAERTQVYVPNDYVFAVCRDDARMVPCPSINPDRRDAVRELDRVVSLGARILKIHPPIQGCDVADPRHRPFFERCAAHDVVVMVHTGHEHSAPIVDPGLADPARLVLALDCGCRVVACHSGTGWPSDSPDFVPHFLELVERYDHLWGDTAVLCTQGRKRDLERLLAHRAARSRLIHGSDFPFPSNPMLFADRLGDRVALELTGDENLLRRDWRLKQDLGLASTFGRADSLVFA